MPDVADDPPVPGVADAATELASGPLPVVLVVDDCAENVTLLGQVLVPHYRVKVATSGARALQVAQKSPPPDLVLLDVMMPGMDGYMVLEHLRAAPATRDIPVLFVTSMDASGDEERGFAAGAVDYITKPFNPSIVLARVRTQLELKRARDWLKDQNTLLEAEIARRMEENLVVQDVTIRALARLAQVRDPETGNHLLRVQRYVRLIGERLRHHPRFLLDPRLIDLMVKSAPLHDIGKVGVPDAILRKPGRLSPEERGIMQTHAMLGYEALAQAERDGERELEFLVIAKEMARSHHEHWDGNGYPDRLSGERIPVSARLMALADVFDALSSHRVYRPAMAPEQVTAIITESRGTHLDPAIVDEFLADPGAFFDVARDLRDSEEDLLRGMDTLGKGR